LLSEAHQAVTNDLPDRDVRQIPGRVERPAAPGGRTKYPSQDDMRDLDWRTREIGVEGLEGASLNRYRTAASALVAILLSIPMGAESRCSLPHYPVTAGDVNEYRTTSRQLDAEGAVVATESTVYREEVLSVENGRFRVLTTTQGNATDSVWLCTEEGLSLKIDDVPGMKITATGPTIPARIEAGLEWTQVFESSGEGFTQKLTTVNRVTGREQVTVIAGTFEAFRVDYEIETIATGAPPSVVRGTQWFAPEVGLVKSTSIVPMEGEISTIETTIELNRRDSK
jgi:hypothetical protein